MLNLTSILCTNGAGVVLLLTLLLNTRKNLRYSLPADRVFYIMVGVDIFQCCLEALTFVINGHLFPGAIFLSYLTNALLYVDNILFALLWTIIFSFLQLNKYRCLQDCSAN